jgi:uncharacterized membrane protein YjjP (DUF1212 family)
MMNELNELMNSFQKMKQQSIENLGKLEKVNPVLFNQIAKDLSVLENSKDIQEIQEIQRKYATNNSQ